MAYKVLEQNGIDNENVDGGAFNRFAAGGRDGIVKGILSECVLSSVGNGVGIAAGLILMCGIRVKITELETLFISGVPIAPTQYQIVAQATLGSDGSLTVIFLLRSSGELRQDAIYAAGNGVYEVKIGSFVHNPDGSISNLLRTLDVINGGAEGLGALEVGTVETTTLASGLNAEFDVTVRQDPQDGKTFLDFTAGIPQGADGVDGEAVHFTPQDLTEQQRSQARKNIDAVGESDLTAEAVARENADKVLTQATNKNFYNLGVYDTVKSNGDGTATIMRKTGYLTCKNIKTIVVSFTYYIYLVLNEKISYADAFSIKSNLFKTATNKNFDGVDRGIYFYDSEQLVIKAVNPNEEKSNTEWGAYLCSNNLEIQYELATSYTETVIENQPIHTLDQKGEDWLRNEWEKGLNLLNPNVYKEGTEFLSLGTAYLENGKTYCFKLWSTNSGNTFTYNDFRIVKIGADVIQLIQQVNLNVGISFTFTGGESGVYRIQIYRWAGDNPNFDTFDYAMLNRGSASYSYKPYYGGIVRARDVPIYFTTATESPAQTIGGDWESLGSFTTNGSKTIYAWRRL